MKVDLYSNVCDENLFQNLYSKYAKSLHDFLYYKYGQNLNPGDKAQDAFVKLWENCDKVTMEKAKSYLFTVANNSMLNEIKHQKVVLKYNTQTPQKKASQETPEYLMEKEEYYQEYQKVLSELTDDQRTAFLLNKAEGKSHAEISEILGVTKKVVEYRIYTAFGILKKELENFNIK